jgi:hypothetical protein
MKYLLACLLMGLPMTSGAQSSPGSIIPPSTTDGRVVLTFSGGHDTVGEDRGRPVILIAAALNASPEVFRDAFRSVKPAPAGQQPDPAQVRLNKQTLMRSLAPYGVTDERLNTVSNYYRYSRSRGEMWRITPAAGYATVQNGGVTGITVTNGGSGYSSAPDVSINGMPNVSLAATLSFGTDLAKNGSIQQIKIQP